MNRQRILLQILLVVAVIGLPVIGMDLTMGQVQREAEQVASQIAPLRAQVSDLRAREEVIGRYEAAKSAVVARLIQDDPFRTIESVLSDLSSRSGMAIKSFEIEGAQPVTELPWLAAYQVSVSVEGTAEQYVELLRLLEEHALLIQLPDVGVSFTKRGPQAPLQVRATLALTFFGAAD